MCTQYLHKQTITHNIRPVFVQCTCTVYAQIFIKCNMISTSGFSSRVGNSIFQSFNLRSFDLSIFQSSIFRSFNLSIFDLSIFDHRSFNLSILYFDLSIFQPLKKIERDRIALVDILKRSTVIESLSSIFKKIDRDRIVLVDL